MANPPRDNPIAAALARSDFFRTADRVMVEAMAADMTAHAWRAGETLFEAGEASDGFYVVLEGAIHLSLITHEGAELTVREAGPGEMFGEIGALDGGPRSAFARVPSGAARTAFMPRGRLEAILARHPALLLDIAGLLCRRLRDTTEQLEGIALYPLRQRLARFILGRGRARGSDRGGGKRAVSIALSQSALATLVGASRPKLNGALIELERSGTIARKGALIVYDLARLTAEAEGAAHAPN